MSLQSSTNVFRGPLFVVGLPRSGTKLLRSLLNEHSRIQLTGVESGFLPYWAERWASYGDLSKRENFDAFYRKTIKFPYFQFAKKGGWLIPADAWFGACQNYEITGVFEALMRHDVGVAHDAPTIWGDKTPQYTNQLALLHKLWPEAKFIHIIRDVRDYCLSMRNAWQKNMTRSAQRWVDDINCARNAAQLFSDQYIEVTYEELTETPENTLRTVCEFLGVEFEATMLQLSRPTERLGDAKHVVGIMQNNSQKYLSEMSSQTRERIEAISLPILQSSRYCFEYSGEARRVPNHYMHIYRVLDGLHYMKFKYLKK